MAQTVFDLGDLITSRLNLGVDPDGTTVASVAVQRPDGTLIAGLVPSPWVGREKTIQFVGDTAGDWLVVWTVTGTGASISPKVYNVVPLPGTGTRPAWSPFLSEVADFVPWLTVDLITPGSSTYLGTFTGYTAPTDEQAQRHIDRARDLIAVRLGSVPDSLNPAARAVVTLRAAASLARAFPRNRSDIDTAADLTAQADAAWAELILAAEASGTVADVTPAPVMYAPAPPWYGDLDL